MPGIVIIVAEVNFEVKEEGVNCIAINPIAELEKQIIHILPFLFFPIVPTLLPCRPLPGLSLSLCNIP